MTRRRNNTEARRLAEVALEPLRSLTYDELVAKHLDRPFTSLVYDRDEREYNLEVQAMWDSRKDRVLRVSSCVDDGSLRWGLFTTSECVDFLIGPDGVLVDE